MLIHTSLDLDPKWALAVLISVAIASLLAAVADWLMRKWDERQYDKYIEEQKRKWRR